MTKDLVARAVPTSAGRRRIRLGFRMGRFAQIAPPLFLLTLILLMWQMMSSLGVWPPKLVPPPTSMFGAFGELVERGWRGVPLVDNVVATVWRAGVGVFLAAIVGIPLGLAMGTSRSIGAVFTVPVQFFRPIPGLAYLVILILWLGSGDNSKIAMLFLVAVPTIITAAAAGVRNVPHARIDVARSLGASQFQLFRDVTLPSTLPMLSTGVRIAAGITLGSVVGAEILVATNGLGWMVFTAGANLRNDIVIVAVIMLGVVGFGVDFGLRQLDGRLIHWRGHE